MESTYKVIEIVGSSPDGWERAAEVALMEAKKSLRDLRIAEVADLDIHLGDNAGKWRPDHCLRQQVSAAFQKGLLLSDPAQGAFVGGACLF